MPRRDKTRHIKTWPDFRCCSSPRSAQPIVAKSCTRHGSQHRGLYYRLGQAALWGYPARVGDATAEPPKVPSQPRQATKGGSLTAPHTTLTRYPHKATSPPPVRRSRATPVLDELVAALQEDVDVGPKDRDAPSGVLVHLGLRRCGARPRKAVIYIHTVHTYIHTQWHVSLGTKSKA